jgi:cytochrome c oxidase assembly protein subunit 15
MSHVHASAVYLLLALTVGLAVAARRVGTPTLASATVLLLVLEVAQGVIGFVQYFTDLPELLVGLHMLGAAVISAGATWVVLAARPRV